MRGKVIDVREQEWALTAAHSDDAFIQGLSDIGVPSDDLKRCMDALHTAKREADHDDVLAKWNDPRYSEASGFDVLERNVPTDKQLNEFRQSISFKCRHSDGEYASRYFDVMVQKVKEILGIVRLETECEKEDEIEVPIFWLHSPNIKGSEVIYEETESKKISNSYRVGFIGTALGKTRSISFSSSTLARSNDGDYKRIFMIAKIKNALISVVSAGKCVNRILRTELAYPCDKLDIEFGIDEITREEFITSNLIPKRIGKRYKLSGDHSGAVHSFKEIWKTSRKKEIEFGINAFNLQSVLKGDLERDIDVKFEYRLPAGTDYEVKKIYNGFGILWNT